jgi:hypothetical protein
MKRLCSDLAGSPQTVADSTVAGPDSRCVKSFVLPSCGYYTRTFDRCEYLLRRCGEQQKLTALARMISI